MLENETHQHVPRLLMLHERVMLRAVTSGRRNLPAHELNIKPRPHVTPIVAAYHLGQGIVP